MTIAISLKVNDGLVLAADSAATIFAQSAPGQPIGVANVYNNANKIFNLVKGLPIAAATWGAGSIGTASISTIAKDLRVRLSGADPDHLDWELPRTHYTIEQAAIRLKEFIYDELYVPAFSAWPGEKPTLGFFVTGYSSKEAMAEEYQIDITKDGQCDGPRLIRQRGESGIAWSGQGEAISRLLLGFSPQLSGVLRDRLGVQPDQLAQSIAVIQQSLYQPLVIPPMPLQDAVDLAIFLVDVTINFFRFSPGAPSVGGPIEVAAISKHEHFKWIRRKHYYSQELNAEVSQWMDHRSLPSSQATTGHPESQQSTL